MISSQYGTIFTNSHYEKIQKVYSIWICFNPPEKRKNSINIYSVKEKILENEYGITMTYEEKEEVEKMCNLSEYVWEKGLREGREEGLRTGINYGELQNLVRMVLKKMRKDVSCEITVELFEEPVEKIRKIYEVAEKYAPEYDIESICRELAA